VNPDKSSIAANARQNAVHDLVDLYDELAFELIDLWKVDTRSCQVLCRFQLDHSCPQPKWNVGLKRPLD
jgi:hypothetical protein